MRRNIGSITRVPRPRVVQPPNHNRNLFLRPPPGHHRDLSRSRPPPNLPPLPFENPIPRPLQDFSLPPPAAVDNFNQRQPNPAGSLSQPALSMPELHLTGEGVAEGHPMSNSPPPPQISPIRSPLRLDLAPPPQISPIRSPPRSELVPSPQISPIRCTSRSDLALNESGTSNVADSSFDLSRRDRSRSPNPTPGRTSTP